MGYGVNYRLNFCNNEGDPCVIDILKKDYTGAILPYIGGGEPIAITLKNTEENKFDQITGSEATITLVTSSNLTLQDFYTGDEREWQVRQYKNGLLKWAGFVMPDSSNEPFRTPPYQAQLKATDIIGSLKTVPYTKGTQLIKKVASITEILSDCFAKTGLELDFWIGVNTYEDSFNKSVNDCPLEQTFIDTNRFIDTNNKPYSCYDVISYIASEFTANVRQSEGAWWFVDVSEYAKTSFNARKFNKDGLKLSNSVIIRNRNSGYKKQLQLVQADHYIRNVAALKSLTTYYQYGYLSSEIVNGDFNLKSPVGSASPFVGWSVFGGLDISVGEKTSKNIAGADVPNGDLFAVIKNYSSTYKPDFNKGLISDSIAVLGTQKMGVSFEVGEAQSQPEPYDGLIFFFKVKATAIGKPDKSIRIWSGAAEWREGVNEVAEIFVSGTANKAIKSISLNIPEIGYDCQISITIFGGYSGTVNANTGGAKITAGVYVDNAKVSLQENEVQKSAIGKVVTDTQVFDYSQTKDAIVFLFGDDGANKQRTSWMRNSAGDPTISWNNGLTLQQIATRKILDQYQKTSKMFEGTFKGEVAAIDTINIDLTNSKFFVLAGTFYVKSSEAKLTLAELFVNPLSRSYVNEDIFEDFGEFKDASGKTVGSSSGVNIPAPNPSQGGGNGFAERLTESNSYLLLDGQKVKAGFADKATEADHAVNADKALVADYANDSDKWDGAHFADFINQPVRVNDNVRHRSISSPSFVSGFSGNGFKIDENGNATFDNLTVRKQFNVFELILNKISGTNGALAVTDTVKIESVVETSSGYNCFIDVANNSVIIPFQIDDLLRCQVFNGTSFKYYFAKVTSVGNGFFTLDKNTKVGAGLPAANDVVVRFGNVTNVNRQGLLYLTASDSNSPYLDVLDGVNSDNLIGKTKIRLGKLNGIVDPDFGALSGYGLYGDNVYLKNGYFKGNIEVTGGNAATQAYANSAANNSSANALANATNLINNIQIGGVNLVNGSLEKDIFNASQNENYIYYQLENGALEPNTKYTLSWEYRTSGNFIPSEAFILPNSGDILNKGGLAATNNVWIKERFTFITSNNYTQASGGFIRFDHNGSSDGNDCQLAIRFPKLEKGTYATSYSLSYFDINQNATNLAGNAQQAAQNYAAIQSAFEREVAKSYADGKITAEEVARINQAAVNLADAKADSQSKFLNAVTNANGYTDSKTIAAIATAQTYADSVSTTKANAAQTAAVVASSANAQSYANTAQNNAVIASQQLINSLSIGGVNLLDNTIQKEVFNPTQNEVYINYSLSNIITPNTTYTLSWEYLTSGNFITSEAFFLPNIGGMSYKDGLTATNNVWVRQFFTFTTGNNYAGTTSGIIRFDHNGSTDGNNCLLTVRNLKLEKGNKPTDYSPSLADTNALITSAQNAANNAIIAWNNLTNQVKGMAFVDLVEASKMGSSLMIGGFFRTDLIDVITIRANYITAGYIKGLNVVAENIQATTGTIGGWVIGSDKLFSGSESGDYIALRSGSSPELYMKNSSQASNEYSSLNTRGLYVLSTGNLLPTSYADYYAVGAFKLKAGSVANSVALYVGAPDDRLAMYCDGQSFFNKSASFAATVFFSGNVVYNTNNIMMANLPTLDALSPGAGASFVKVINTGAFAGRLFRG